MRTFLVGLFLSLLPAAALAQFKEQTADKGARLDRQSTVRIRVGLIVKAGNAVVHHIVATAPVPTEWPEQRVSIVNEDVSPSVKGLTYRNITGGGGLKQMVVEIPQLLAGQEAKALVTFEVTRNVLAAPADTSIYKIPKKVDRATNLDLGTSPYIESRHPKIVAAAKEAVADADTDWKKAEAIYDWAREHVIYKNGELKLAARALYEKEGGADELTSLFIAMCRAKNSRPHGLRPRPLLRRVLSRRRRRAGTLVPLPAGRRALLRRHRRGAPDSAKRGQLQEPREPQRAPCYVTEYFTAAGRGSQPKVEFVSELVAE